MKEPTNLANHFLIAMPELKGTCFGGAVTFICEHSIDRGALGIIINKPINAKVASSINSNEITHSPFDAGDIPLYFGGPVQTDQGFVLHRPVGKWESTSHITSDIGLTTSMDIVSELGEISHESTESPRDYLVSVGYSGWSPGQLENEILNNAWLITIADPEIIFQNNHQDKLKAAMDMIGVSSLNLATGYGHA